VLGALPGAKYLKLTHREDLTHALADVAKRHCAARVHHSAELRALEGDNLFDTLTTYRAVAERARGTPRSCSVRCARASLASKLRCCLI
jgi:hypothetical protein